LICSFGVAALIEAVLCFVGFEAYQKTGVRLRKTILVFIIIAGALLRFGGLSHGLHEHLIYHPDTHKQVLMTERYLKGYYYVHTGIIDYDGYPYLNSRIVEVMCRIGMPIRTTVLNFLGVPTEEHIPNVFALYWLTLLLNATLATLTILLAYKIACEAFGPTAGLIAAILLAFSPADVTACHYANGDSTAGFLATLSLLFALRIYQHGRYRDYVLAAIFAACGFAAKYHAGTVIFSIACAHILRCGSLKRAFGLESWGRLVLAALIGVVTLVICIPPLFTYTGPMLSHIWEFLTHVSSNRRLPHEMQDAGFFGKFEFSMKRNIPLMLRILSPVAVLAAVAAVVRPARGKFPQALIIAALPAVYFVVGVSLRPLSHAVYHTLMTPAVFILAAAMLSRLFDREAYRASIWRLAGLVAVLGAAIPLYHEAYSEAYFQWHMDTRRMATEWVKENVPGSFAAEGNPGFGPIVDSQPEGPKGILHWTSNVTPWPPPDDFMFFKNIGLEEKPLTQFRNPVVSFSVGMSPCIRKGFTMPVVQRWPSLADNQFVFDNGASFFRDDKIFMAKVGSRISRKIVTEQPLKQVFMLIQNGPIANIVDVSCAGDDRTLFLKAGESAWYIVSKPVSGPPRGRGFFFYDVRVFTEFGPAKALFATCAADIGRGLYAAGRYQDALPWLEQAAVETKSPTLAVLAEFCGFLTNPDKPRPPAASLQFATNILNCTNDAGIMAAYSISPEYLQALNFIRLYEKDINHFTVPVESELVSLKQVVREITTVPFEDASLATPRLMLDPGYYECTTWVRWTNGSQNVSVPVCAMDDFSRSYHTSLLSFQSTSPHEPATNAFMFYVPHGSPSTTLMFTPGVGMGLSVKRVDLRPAILREVTSLANVHRLIRDQDITAVADEPAAYDALLVMGNRFAKTNLLDKAMQCFIAAAKLRPTMSSPLDGILDLLARDPALPYPGLEQLVAVYRDARSRHGSVECNVLFENGVRLRGAVARDITVSHDGKLGLNLMWELNDRHIRLLHTAVSVHVVDASGKIMFQGDHNLIEDLKFAVFARETSLPATVTPGVYRIRVGLYHPREDGSFRAFKVQQSDIDHTKSMAILPFSLKVTE